jgi:NADPH:quinone reductase-like Zn-dependent oxidoreductase
MRAIVYRNYGGPEVLELADVDKPVARAGEVVVRVCATSVNAADYRFMRADPFLARLNNGLFTPKKQILGVDLAGVVDTVGPGVSAFAPGQAVIGETLHDELGGFAEYVRVREASLASKPEGLSFEEAAAMPLVGMTALQAVRLASLQPGQAVAIQGAGGGVGMALVQLVKARGATVTAVCGAGSASLVSSLGADRLVDYAREDFTAGGEQYDVVFGVNGYHPLSDYKRCLKPGGMYVGMGGTNAQIFEALLQGRFRFMFSGKRIATLNVDGKSRQADLRELAQLLAQKKLKPVVDRVFKLEQTADAVRYLETGHVRGKVVITVQEG